MSFIEYAIAICEHFLNQAEQQQTSPTANPAPSQPDDTRTSSKKKVN